MRQRERPTGSRPMCYDCRHRGQVPGSCHSACLHPATEWARNEPMNQAAALLGKRSGLYWCALDTQAASLHVEAADRGIYAGWFLWPVNFDPVWLERCEGFEPPNHEEREVKP
jgi:hypothetical protein